MESSKNSIQETQHPIYTPEEKEILVQRYRIDEYQKDIIEYDTNVKSLLNWLYQHNVDEISILACDYDTSKYEELLKKRLREEHKLFFLQKLAMLKSTQYYGLLLLKEKTIKGK